MSTLITNLIIAFLLVAFVLAIIPPMLWGYNNYIRIKKGGNIPYKLVVRHKKSWIYCYAGVILTILAAILLAYT